MKLTATQRSFGTGSRMKSQQDGFGYNERLFSGGIRTFLHTARFAWFVDELARRGCSYQTIVELGCFDGKLIDYLPLKPDRYVGFDANWEGGIDKAKEKWSAYPNYAFHKVATPDAMSLEAHERFDIAVIMETLEHVPPGLVEGYLAKIAEHLNGYLFVTVPNEKGIVSLAKWLAKKLFSRDAEHYSLAEAVNATLGRMHRVCRREHKGFDYTALIREIGKHFEVISVSGHPLRFLPSSLCFSVGIVARSRGD